MTIPASGSFNHSVAYAGGGDYWIRWEVDVSRMTDRIRHTSLRSRLTSRQGAIRFAKRWNIMPHSLPPEIERVLEAERVAEVWRMKQR